MKESMSKEPDGQPLLIVGFLKCGTTSLSRHLSVHPDIATPVAKELYYFLDEGSSLVSMQNVINKLAFNRDVLSSGISFQNYFPNAAGSKFLMDATPFYYSQQSCIDFLSQYPGARIIFMLRDPAKRLMSSFRFFQGMYQEYPDSSFEEFTNALLDINGTRAPYRERINKQFFKELFDSEIEMGCYWRHISRWKEVFDRDQLYIGTMERLRDEPAEMMAEICKFLGITDEVYNGYDFKPFMQSYKVRYPRLQKLGRHLGKEDPMRFDRISQFQNPFHRITFNPVRRGLEALYKKLQHAEVQSDFAQSFALLDNVYRSHSEEIFSELGIDYRRRNSLEELIPRRSAG